MRDKVLKALEKVKVMLSADGGSAEFVDFTSDRIIKKKMGIELIIKKEVPEVKSVVAA